MTDDTARDLYEKYRHGDPDVDRDEAIADLQELQGSFDQEIAHIVADEILCTLLEDEEVVAAYRDIGKWYA